MKPVVLLGFFSEIIELCERKSMQIKYVVDPNIQILGNGEGSVPFSMVPTEKEILTILGAEIDQYSFVVVPDSPKKRKNIIHILEEKEKTIDFPSLIDENVILSNSATLGKGVVIMGGSLVSSNSLLGDFVKMNFFARVHHDVCVGDFTTIAPGATLLGRVSIGKGVYIGANATILPEITVGDWSIVGAGAVVTRNVGSNETVIGIPAKRKNNLS